MDSSTMWLKQSHGARPELHSAVSVLDKDLAATTITQACLLSFKPITIIMKEVKPMDAKTIRYTNNSDTTDI